MHCLLALKVTNIERLLTSHMLTGLFNTSIINLFQDGKEAKKEIFKLDLIALKAHRGMLKGTFYAPIHTCESNTYSQRL